MGGVGGGGGEGLGRRGGGVAGIIVIHLKKDTSIEK